MIDPLQLRTEIEAAEILRVSRSTVRERFTPIHISERGTRYLHSDIADYIASKMADAEKSRALSLKYGNAAERDLTRKSK